MGAKGWGSQTTSFVLSSTTTKEQKNDVNDSAKNHENKMQYVGKCSDESFRNNGSNLMQQY